ncbi:MAG: serine/threonine protein kinase [Thermoanaerobaculaceae bacterium]|jgi:hypothetical protein|nr:serine/threonine protein kinase [Thermoanaerobaculaceae bacterium]
MPEGLPRRIGAYELQRVIARGGMATVFLAVATGSGRQVAFKRILPQIASDPEFVARFRHEVQIHASLHHLNILAVLDFAAGPGDYYIVMELAEGGTLRELVDGQGPFLPEVGLFVAGEVLRGLACAHASGIVHRDVKPHNVLITASGDLKVADFGISKTEQMTRLTATGALIGTPAYMSPEQATLADVDSRTDLFSTGVMLYEMLAGANPFNTGNPVTSLRMVAEHHPRPLSEVDLRIPVPCELLVERLLAKSRDDRPATAGAAAAAIDALLASMGVKQPRALFADFLRGGDVFVARFRRERGRAHLERGKALLAAGQASDELVLWELHCAQVLNREDQEARRLAGELAARSGYAVDHAPVSERAKELERKLAVDPGNVSLLLQLAKLHKMQRCFPGLMRGFFRLRQIPIADPYLQGQVAALVARAGVPGVAEGGGAVAVRGAVELPPPAPAPAAATTPLRASRLRQDGVTVATPPRPGAPAPAPRFPEPRRVSPGPPAPEPARVSSGGVAAGPVPLGFRIGFALAALLFLAGLLRLLTGG